MEKIKITVCNIETGNNLTSLFSYHVPRIGESITIQTPEDVESFLIEDVYWETSSDYITSVTLFVLK